MVFEKKDVGERVRQFEDGQCTADGDHCGVYVGLLVADQQLLLEVEVDLDP